MSPGLDITAPCPRVNAQLMGEFVGKKVRLVGRVDGVDGGTLRLRTCDDVLVTVNLQGVAPQVRTNTVTATRGAAVVAGLCVPLLCLHCLDLLAVRHAEQT